MTREAEGSKDGSAVFPAVVICESAYLSQLIDCFSPGRSREASESIIKPMTDTGNMTEPLITWPVMCGFLAGFAVTFPLLSVVAMAAGGQQTYRT